MTPPPWEPIQPTDNLHFRCSTHEVFIRLADVPEGWAWCVSWSRWIGDHSGGGFGIGRRDGAIRPEYVAPTRAEAIAAASAYLARLLPDKPVLDWLDSLNPSQADLFA